MKEIVKLSEERIEREKNRREEKELLEERQGWTNRNVGRVIGVS
jgi:hypothetical protein